MLMEVCNSMVLLKEGILVCSIFPILAFQIQTESGLELTQIEKELVPLPLAAGIHPLIPVLITLQGVLFIPVFYGFVSATNSYIVCVLTVCGECITPVLKVLSS